jgi:hypothetical protein
MTAAEPDPDVDAVWRSDPDLTQLVTKLDALRTPVAEISDARLDAIEARIGAMREVEPSASARSRARVALLATAAALIAVVTVAFGMLGDDRDRLVIAAADGVEVVLPTGAAVEGRAGLELPDGTVLTVTGFVDVEGTRFGPGTYVVDASQLERLADAADDRIEDADDRIEDVTERDLDQDLDVDRPATSVSSGPVDTTAPATAAPGRVDPAPPTSVVRPTAEGDEPVPTTVGPGRAVDASPATVRPAASTTSAPGPAPTTNPPAPTTNPTRPTTTSPSRPATTAPATSIDPTTTLPQRGSERP